MPGTRKLGRASDHRKAMLRAMVTYLLENGKIETTVTRAKEVSAMTEKMITLGKAGDLHSSVRYFPTLLRNRLRRSFLTTSLRPIPDVTAVTPRS